MTDTASLDNVDIRIIGDLLQGTSSFGIPRGIRGSLKQISEKLGLDKDTVRKRIKKLQKAGVIQGWQIVCNPSLLGARTFMIHVEVDPDSSSKKEVMRKMNLIPGVIGVADSLGRDLMVGIVCESEQSLKRHIDLISELAKVKISWHYEIHMPEVNSKFTLTDWKLMRALRKNPLVTYKELGKAIGMSSRAAARRLNWLIDGRAALMLPLINFRAISGAIPIDLFVFYTSSLYKKEVDSKIISRYKDSIIRAGFGGPERGHFTFIMPSLEALQEMLDWIKDTKEVKETRIYFVLEQSFAFEPYDDLIEKKIIAANK